MRPWGFNRQRALRALTFANRHMERGQYPQAADIYERLAKGAEDRGILERAPYLYLQAGRARLLASQIERGDSLIRHGLTIFVRTNRWLTLQKTGQGIVNEIQRMGHDDIADGIQEWLHEELKNHPEGKITEELSIDKVTPQASLMIPSNCPKCGAGLHPNEIEWINKATVQCAYCGSAVSLQD